jgi:2,5-diketo-D-gluconate reductase A
MKTAIPSVRLNDGKSMPQFGLGVWKATNEEAESTVLSALAAGYRLVDTAKIYENEEGVGRALQKTEIPREEIFVTTKLWNTDQGYEQALMAMRDSLRRLQLKYVDLYLIHWPVPRQDLYVESWRALLKMRQEGLAKSVGVSNFTPQHLQRIIDETGELPAVNQIELHPRFAQRDARTFHAKHGIITEAWSPLDRGFATEEPVIKKLAQKHGKTPAQIILRWHIQEELVGIPKTVNPKRLLENMDLFDFTLDAADMITISALDRGAAARRGGDPEVAHFGLSV